VIAGEETPRGIERFAYPSFKKYLQIEYVKTPAF
jgi:hypothetical protein